MKQEDEGSYVSIAGKISTRAYGRLTHILRKKKLNIYQMIQNVCDCFIRYMDDKHNMTPDSEKAVGMFEHMIGWEDNFNLADQDAKPEIAEATYYIVDANGRKDKGGKKGVRVMHVERPFFGQWTQNFNLQQILERFMCLTFPQLYRRLRFIAVSRECTSILELLLEVVGDLEREEEKKELREPFEDADRSEWGIKPAEKPYRRRHNKSDDTLFKEELI